MEVVEKGLREGGDGGMRRKNETGSKVHFGVGVALGFGRASSPEFFLGLTNILTTAAGPGKFFLTTARVFQVVEKSLRALSSLIVVGRQTSSSVSLSLSCSLPLSALSSPSDPLPLDLTLSLPSFPLGKETLLRPDKREEPVMSWSLIKVVKKICKRELGYEY